MASNIIEVENLIVKFYTYEGVVQALENVSFCIGRGSTFGLVGESGCGKSVTARAIMQIIQEPGRIEDGRIFMFRRNGDGSNGNGTDLLKQSDSFMEDVRGNDISMIFQEPNAALNPIMSIGEQVSESFLIHRRQMLCDEMISTIDKRNGLMGLPVRLLLKDLYRGVRNNRFPLFYKLLERLPLVRNWNRGMKKAAMRHSATLLGTLGISHPERAVELYPHNLSGGMKQRIVIAIGLASNPLLLIADEATSNLDVTIQAQILELLKTLKKDFLDSILLITHDLGVVAETCDRVGVMYAGAMCEIADVKEIFGNPLHPYTMALLDSVPKLKQEGRLASIPGTVPNLVNPPTGCRFHPRCMTAMPICKHSAPELRRISKDHLVACHNYGPASSKG